MHKTLDEVEEKDVSLKDVTEEGARHTAGHHGGGRILPARRETGSSQSGP
jgi:hypothetical protein